MRKKQVKPENIVSVSDKQKDKEWLVLYRQKRKQGIIITFKPSRYYTTEDYNRIQREIAGFTAPPGYKNNNSVLPQDKEKEKRR